MSTQENKNWSDDPRLTAYALGELHGAELEQLRAEIEGDDEAQALVEELQAMGAVLEAEFAAEAVSDEAPTLSDVQRARIEESVFVEPRKVGMSVWQWAGVAVTALFVAGAGLYLAREAGPLRVAVLGDTATAEARPTASVERTDMNGLGYSSHRLKESRTTSEDMRTLELLGYSGAAVDLEAELDDGRPRELLEGIGYIDPSEDSDDGIPRFASDGEQGEAPSREQYAAIHENPFLLTSNAPLSTFSVDVDTASYSNVRRMINEGHLPNPDAVRIEELVNYFPYSYPQPSGDAPFSVNVEVGSAPWASTHRLLRIGLKGRETHAMERSASNLVFLLDVSGSMNNADKLPLLKHALRMLVQNLNEADRIAIVVYAGSSGLILPSTSCDESVSIEMALERLEAGGSTNGGAGIELAYDVARRNFIEGGINRVILATDGDFNVGVTDDGSLTRLIQDKAKTGVFLTVLGFGSGNLQDAKMEQLANKGNGNYAYIDSVREARKVLVEELGSTLETIAKDVKLQLEFNPLRVQAYRLLGYENRMLAAQDFNDDQKDAGEIGAGHTVTALYEIVPVGVELDVPGVDPLKYQTPTQPAGAAFSREMLHLKLRYKAPDGDVSKLIESAVVDGGNNFDELSADSRFAASVAAFGMLLRNSRHKGDATWELAIRWAAESLGEDPGGYRTQFLGLAGRALELSD